jgi:uncharacterized membrane protein SpoIIM required for sporulation
MLSNRWISLREPGWNQLTALLHQVESTGLKSLSTEDLRLLGLLYRQTAADLSTARAEEAAGSLVAYLNGLVSRAHHLVYAGSTSVSPAGVARFFATEYPQLFRRLLPYTSLAFFLFLGAALLGALVTDLRPEYGRAFLGPVMMHTIEQHKMWTDRILSVKPEASSAIMTNNISVCFMTFAGGSAAGLGTLYMMLNNRWMMGVIAVVCAGHGLSLSLWSFVASHGALELPSIFLSGGAGFRMAAGLLFPGYLRRGAALALAGAEAVRLLAGTVPLLIVAGSLEAFLSPTHAPVALKFSVGASLFAALLLWLFTAGREPSSVPFPQPALSPAL